MIEAGDVLAFFLFFSLAMLVIGIIAFTPHEDE